MSGQAVRQIELKQICFIDDSKTSAYVTKKLLKQQGYGVDHFPDAESALEALMENAYDLVITDLMISADGGVNGDDLIRLIRHSGHPTKSNIPIMVVTGASDISIYDDLLTAGANKVLQKPLDERLLEEAINDLIPKMTHFGSLSLAEEKAEKATPQQKAETPQVKVPEPEKPKQAELMDLDLELGAEFDDVLTESILPDLDNSKHKKFSVKKEKPVKTEAKKEDPVKKSPAKVVTETIVEKKAKVSQPEIDIPVLTSVITSDSEAEAEEEKQKQKIQIAKTENEISNRAIAEQIEKLVEQKVEQKIETEVAKKISSLELNPSDIGIGVKEIERSAEISSEMKQSIQDELVQIDEAAAQKVESESTSSAQPEIIQPITVQSAAMPEEAVKKEEPQPVAEKTVEQVVEQTVIQTTEQQVQEKPIETEKMVESVKPEPVVPKPVAQPIIAEAPPQAAEPAPKPVEANSDKDNPLLALLNHMDDPDLGTDFSASKAKKSAKLKVAPNLSSFTISKSVWIVLILAMVLPASIFWYLGQQAIDVHVVEVHQLPIHSEISVPGRIVSKRNIKVSARASGQLMQVKVKEGDRVKKGQTLASMDDKEAKSNVKRAQARLMSSQEEVAATSKTQERLQRALDLGAVARQIVDDAEAVWKSASAKQSEIEEELISAELKLDRLQIKAPFSGLITSVSVQEGQWLSLAEEILTLVDMDQRVVEIRVDVSDSARLNIGQEVMISSEAFDGKSWKETIRKIGEEAQTEDSVNVIKVQTSLGLDAPKLRIGQQVDAEIRVASRNNALTLPHNILFTHNGSPHAAVVENGKIVFIPIVTGIESVTHVEIVKGLRIDQEVIIPTGVPLEQGMNAVVKNSKINPG